MRKTLLTAALALSALAANAQGITTVGANIVVLPSSRWEAEGSAAGRWTAKTMVFYPGMEYGDWDDMNPLYNEIWGEPEADANGKEWFEADYDETTLSEDWYGYLGDEDGMLHWEDHTAPFSSDENWRGNKSFQWTTNVDKHSMVADLYLRRHFTTDKLLSGDVYLACGHDDAPCEYYINGVKVFEKTGFDIDHYDYIYDVDYDEEGNEIRGEVIDSIPRYKNGWNDSEVYKLTEEQKDLIRLGGQENVMAVHVHQNWGGAFADCGLYTLVEGGLEMGYVNSWDGKVLFNSWGGYNDKEGHNNGTHGWEKLYEAQEGDVYTVHMLGSSAAGEWGSQVHFKSALNLDETHKYTFKVKLHPSCAYTDVTIKLCENDNDENVACDEDVISIGEDSEEEYTCEIDGVELNNFKIVFDFAGGTPESTIKISGMSLVDETTGEEMWIGTHYFNYMYVTSTNEETGDVTHIKDPVIDGRVETMAWTLPDFDDSMWDTKAMPIGNRGYAGGLEKSLWPGNMFHPGYYGDGDYEQNTNLWVRRTFEMDKINPRLSYALNVCHDDSYETYVNGHLLQKNDGWTNGTSGVQVHIPAKYLNVGKNVIATYIQQNFGGRFYDCGINVEEVNYQECADALKAAIALGDKKAVLTNAMQHELDSLIAAGKYELETNMDAAEVKEYAKVMTENVNRIYGYEQAVKNLKTVGEFMKTVKDNGEGYMTRGMAEFENFETLTTGQQCNDMVGRLRMLRRMNAQERHTEKYVGTSLEEIDPYAGVKYYFYNVGQRLFLGGGESWGAHDVLEYASNAFALVPYKRNGEELAENVYRIETFRPNGDLGKNDFLAHNGYVDCDTDDAWELVPVEGKANVFNITRAGDHNTMLGYRDGKGNGYGESWNVVDTDMKGADSENNQWMLITKYEMDMLMQTATAENPVDATHLISNPGFDQRLTDAAWVHEGSGGIGIWGRGGDHPDFVFEAWNTTSYNLYQDIIGIAEAPDYVEYEALPAGWYEVAVQGYYRSGSYDEHMRKFGMKEPIEVNGFLRVITDTACDSIALCSMTDYVNQSPLQGRLDDFKIEREAVDPETGDPILDEQGNPVRELVYQGPGVNRAPDACTSAAEEYFEYGLYWNRMLVYVENPGYIQIGVYKKDGVNQYGDWIVVDNFRLKYMGNEDIPEDVIDGMGDEIVAPVKAEGKTIYNLAGQRIQKTQKGVNIVNGKKFIVK